MYWVMWPVHWAVQMEQYDWTEEEMQYVLEVLKEKNMNILDSKYT